MNDRLVVMNPWATSIEDPTELEAIDDGLFRMVAPTGGGAVGEVVRFVEENGEVVRMITGDSYADRCASKESEGDAAAIGDETDLNRADTDPRRTTYSPARPNTTDRLRTLTAAAHGQFRAHSGAVHEGGRRMGIVKLPTSARFSPWALSARVSVSRHT